MAGPLHEALTSLFPPNIFQVYAERNRIFAANRQDRIKRCLERLYYLEIGILHCQIIGMKEAVETGILLEFLKPATMENKAVNSSFEPWELWSKDNFLAYVKEASEGYIDIWFDLGKSFRMESHCCNFVVV